MVMLLALLSNVPPERISVPLLVIVPRLVSVPLVFRKAPVWLVSEWPFWILRVPLLVSVAKLLMNVKPPVWSVTRPVLVNMPLLVLISRSALLANEPPLFSVLLLVNVAVLLIDPLLLFIIPLFVS